MEYIIFTIIFGIIVCFFTWVFAVHVELHKIQNEIIEVLKHLGPSSRYRQGMQMAFKLTEEMYNNFMGDYKYNKTNKNG